MLRSTMYVTRLGSVRRPRSSFAARPTAMRSRDSEQRDGLGVGDPLAVERLVEDREVRSAQSSPSDRRSAVTKRSSGTWSSSPTSTTRTSASRTATSAPSTAAPATRARATCCRSRSSSRRSRRRSRSAARAAHAGRPPPRPRRRVLRGLFCSIKARYPIHLHALSPSEIQHISRRSKLTIPETLTRLRDAGLDSLPGGGAEILVDRVRDIIAPKKTTSAEWLDVMRHAQRLGMSTTATMMYGHVETLAERIEHMRRIRELQDETHGFRAFISWTFQDDGNRLGAKVPRETMPTSFDYLLTQAVSRIYLDNVDHIQSSWVTQGMKIGQVALDFGADDIGSVMIEENVVSAAGTTHRASTEELVHLDRALGKIPCSATRSTATSGSGTDAAAPRLPSDGVMRLLLVFAALAAALVPLASAQEPATLMTPVVADAISDLRAAHFAHAARARSSTR